jgi:glutamate/tyrosine decarboxylase-like PLP-dependent enzyme
VAPGSEIVEQPRYFFVREYPGSAASNGGDRIGFPRLARRAARAAAGIGGWVRAVLGGPLPEQPSDAFAVVEQLARGADPGLMAMPSGRFFGGVIGGSIPAAIAADWLTSAWDQNAALALPTPAAGVVEEVAGAWLKELLGLPESASFGFVTGCQMAHFTCLAAARHHLLARVGWDVQSTRDSRPGAEVPRNRHCLDP